MSRIQGYAKKEKTEQNKTGLPPVMKKRVEQSTGFSLDDVQVHYNSDKPSKVDALAYTQGNHIYISPGQEYHLPHELGHVVQQKLGLVPADTRHPSGEAMNTDKSLEEAADQIGMGNETGMSGRNSYVSEQPIQRMSVAVKPKGAPEQQTPVIKRYKPEGWSLIQGLKEYFTPESLRTATLADLKGLCDALTPLTEPENEISLQKLSSKLIWTENFTKTFTEQRDHLRQNIKNLIALIGNVETMFSAEEKASGQVSVTSIEKRGNYQPVSTEALDPYKNYKKIAMHCIAHFATKIPSEENDSGEDPGPHIAMAIFGSRIYIANNTSFKTYEHKDPVDMKTLKNRVRRGIASIKKEDIKNIINDKKGFFVSGAGFEGENNPVSYLNDQEINEVFSWIQKIYTYPILVIDSPEYRQNPSNNSSPFHGEMMLMDYFEQEMKSPGEINIEGVYDSTNKILTQRNQKLDRITDKSNTYYRVIQFGGTRMDCKKCHEHFEKLRTAITNNYVISSQKTTPRYFRGTEQGTHPKRNQSAPEHTRIVVSECLEGILEELEKLKSSLETLVTQYQNDTEEKKDSAINISEEEAQLIDQLTACLPDIANLVEEQKYRHLQDLIYRITYLYVLKKV